MGRPPLPVGTFDTIHFQVLGRNRVQAGASFRDFDGRRRYVVRNGPTRAQAERRLREALRDRGSAETPPVPVDSRLSAMAALWLADVDDSELAAGSKRPYRFVVHAYVLPGLGELRLGEVTVPAIDRLLASVHADHGPGAAKSSRSVLSGILGLAVRHGLLTTNPVRDATARRTPRTARGPRALTVEEAHLLQARLAADACGVAAGRTRGAATVAPAAPAAPGPPAGSSSGGSPHVLPVGVPGYPRYAAVTGARTPSTGQSWP